MTEVGVPKLYLRDLGKPLVTWFHLVALSSVGDMMNMLVKMVVMVKVLLGHWLLEGSEVIHKEEIVIRLLYVHNSIMIKTIVKARETFQSVILLSADPSS